MTPQLGVVAKSEALSEAKSNDTGPHSSDPPSIEGKKIDRIPLSERGSIDHDPATDGEFCHFPIFDVEALSLIASKMNANEREKLLSSLSQLFDDPLLLGVEIQGIGTQGRYFHPTIELGNLDLHVCFTNSAPVVSDISTEHHETSLVMVGVKSAGIKQKTSRLVRVRRNHANKGVRPEKDWEQFKAHLPMLKKRRQLFLNCCVVRIEKRNHRFQMRPLESIGLCVFQKLL